MTEHTTQPSETVPTEAVNPAPAGSVHIHSDVGVTVHVTSSGPAEGWFQMLEQDIKSGRWARLGDRHRNVLVVACQRRNRDTGMAKLPFGPWICEKDGPQEGLMTLTGYSRSQLYKTLREMCADPALLRDALRSGRERPTTEQIEAAGLLAECGPDQYLVQPGRVFAGRKPLPSDSVYRGGKTVHAGGRLSPRAWNPSTAEDVSSTPVDEVRFTHKEARARSNRIETLVDDELFLSLTRASHANSVGGPFPADQARMLIRDYGAEAVRIAVRNADALGQGGKIIKGWRNYVVGQLKAGVVPTLFTKLAQSDDDAQRNSDLVTRLVELDGDTDMAAMVKAWWASRSETQRAKLITKHERGKTDEYVWRYLCQKAFDAYQRGSFRMPASSHIAP